MERQWYPSHCHPSEKLDDRKLRRKGKQDLICGKPWIHLMGFWENLQESMFLCVSISVLQIFFVFSFHSSCNAASSEWCRGHQRMVPADGPTASSLRGTPRICVEHRDVGPAPGSMAMGPWNVFFSSLVNITNGSSSVAIP